MSKAQCHREGLLEKGLGNAFGNDLSIMLVHMSCPLKVCSSYLLKDSMASTPGHFNMTYRQKFQLNSHEF